MIKKLDPELLSLLVNIQEKLSSPLFNGGFEAISAAIDDIKISGRKTEEHIVKIDKAIYEPDEGLFSRVKHVATESIEHDKEIQHKILELSSSVDTRFEALETAINTRLDSLEKTRAWWIKLSWALFPIFAAIVVKSLYDTIVSHIHISIK